MTKKLEDYPTVTPALQYEGAIMYVQDAPYYSAATIAEVIAERDAALAKLADMTDDYMRRHNDAVSHFERIKVLESDLAAARAEGEQARKTAEYWKAEHNAANAELCALAQDADRYDYLITCDFVAAKAYLPGIVETEWKSKLRAKHDAAIQASKDHCGDANV